MRGAAVTAALYRNGGWYASLRGITGPTGRVMFMRPAANDARGVLHDAGAPGGRGRLRLGARHAGEPLLQAQAAAAAVSAGTGLGVADL